MSFVDFMANYGEYITFAVYAVVSIVLFFRTKNIKYIKELNEAMKYRTATYRETEESPSQEFDRYKPVYRLNKATGELELTDERIDIQELIDSCRDICLQSCLERFMPQEDATDEIQDNYDEYLDDLDGFTEYLDKAEMYREKFNLSDELSAEEIFDHVSEQADKLKTRLDEIDKARKESRAVNAAKADKPSTSASSGMSAESGAFGSAPSSAEKNGKEVE
nr:MAG TPA: hypothetical protein [Microviridae sp.]